MKAHNERSAARGDGVTDIDSAFALAIAAMDSHRQMSNMYETLSQLSDDLSALRCRPWFDDAPESEGALAALDDFVMQQIDLVKEKALDTKPLTWEEWEARAFMLVRYSARTQMDIGDVYKLLDQMRIEVAPARILSGKRLTTTIQSSATERLEAMCEQLVDNVDSGEN